jgi:hypothetical protein
MLKLHDYNDPDDYGHSAYAIEDTDLVVEFYFFENRLYQSNISIHDSGEADRWVGYLESKFGKKENDGKFRYWDQGQLRILYASESGVHRFYFVDVNTFIDAQEFRKAVDSNQARLIEFKLAVENRVNWNSNPESLPDISLYQKKELFQWDVYTHNHVKNLDYHFFRNRLCGIDFFVRDPKQAKKMAGILKKNFGEGVREVNQGSKWEVNGVNIMSTPSTAASYFLFRHKETWAEKKEYEKKYAISIK